MGNCTTRAPPSNGKIKKVRLPDAEKPYKLYYKSSLPSLSKNGNMLFGKEGRQSIIMANGKYSSYVTLLAVGEESSCNDNISHAFGSGSISSHELSKKSESISVSLNDSSKSLLCQSSITTSTHTVNSSSVNRQMMREITLISLDLYTCLPLCGCPDLLSELRTLTKRLYRFSSIDKFLKRFNHTRIEFLWIIISGAVDIKNVITRIQHICSIECIYICNYLSDESDCNGEMNVENIFKVRGTYNNIEDLKQRLSDDLRMRDAHMPVMFTSLPRPTSQRTTFNLNTESANFLCFQVLIDILLRSQRTDAGIKELVHACRLYYSHDFEQQKQICEFEYTYRSSDVLKWYSKDSFLYRLLNQVFRTQHLEGLFLFRTFIADLHARLKEIYLETLTTIDKNNSLRVYRGQRISLSELTMLKENIGNCISVNGFLSTSTDSDVAYVFARQDSSETNSKPVLFEIDVDMKIPSVPFADISTHSCSAAEKEVLFSIGSVFRVQTTLYDVGKAMWIVRLQNCSSVDESTNELLRYYKDEFGERDGSKTLLSLANMLLFMGEYYRAETFYLLLLDTIPRDDPQIATICTNIGSACGQRGDYKRALLMFDRALKVKSSADATDMACLYNNIGFVYYAQRKYKRALQYFTTSLDFVPVDPLHIGATYNNIALIYTSLHELDEAKVYYSNALSEMRRFLPSNHPRVAILLNNIASLEFKKGDWEAAFMHYTAALDIYMKTLPSHHPDIAITYKNLAIVHKRAGRLQKSLECYQRALDILINSLAVDHPNIITLQTTIQAVKKQMDELEKENNPL